jgi:hypothetical protein
MPKLTRYFIKSGLVNFVLALILAVILQCAPLMDWPAFIVYLNPVYFHLFMVGWITQMIMGVSLWMFPPFSKDHPRGSEVLGWASFICLNSGLLIRVISEPMIFTEPTSGWSYVLVASGVLQWFAGLFYVSNIWIRVRGK